VSDATPRGSVLPALRRRGVRSVVILVAVALVAAGVSFALARSGVGGTTSLDKPVSLQQSPGAGNGAVAGAPGGQGQPGGGAAASSSGSGGAQASATPRTPAPTIAPTPGNQLAGTADWQTSSCGAGWDPGVPCKVYYHGTYILFGVDKAKLVLTAKTPSGTVLDTQTFDAPTGGHRWGGYMTYPGPTGNEVDFEAVVLDSSGKQVMQSNIFKVFNS